MKIWEAKAAKRAAKATGFTLMAVSLAACQSDDATDAALSVTAVDADLTDFVGETKDDLVDAIKTSDNDTVASDAATAALTDADGNEFETVDAAIISGEEANAFETVKEVNSLLGTEFTVETDLDDIIAAIQSSDNEAEILAALQVLVPDAETVEDVFDAGAASRDDEVATLTEDLDDLLNSLAPLTDAGLTADAGDLAIMTAGTTLAATNLTLEEGDTIVGRGDNTVNVTATADVTAATIVGVASIAISWNVNAGSINAFDAANVSGAMIPYSPSKSLILLS